MNLCKRLNIMSTCCEACWIFCPSPVIIQSIYIICTAYDWKYYVRFNLTCARTAFPLYVCMRDEEEKFSVDQIKTEVHAPAERSHLTPLVFQKQWSNWLSFYLWHNAMCCLDSGSLWCAINKSLLNMLSNTESHWCWVTPDNSKKKRYWCFHRCIFNVWSFE